MADGALALQGAGRASPFQFGATWKQSVRMKIENKDWKYTLKSISWQDEAEEAGDD